MIAVKGAPDVVLKLCNRVQKMDNTVEDLTDEKRKEITAANDDMTKDALRVLGMAYRVVSAKPDEVDSETLEKDLIFAGLVGMIDPAREEVKPALLKAIGAGIRTIMITGDYPNTAKAIAQSIGCCAQGHKVRTGADVDEMSDDTLKEEVEEIDVFARVSPEHKMRIVNALRAKDQVVAMTGDGVNDAPAIKAADIGVAMGITGTDVAKETADMVLTDDNYASIVSAVEQGRIIYSNIRKFVYFLISCNMAEIMIIFHPDHVRAFPVPESGALGLLSPSGTDPTAMAESGHRWRTGARAGHGKRRSRHHGSAAAPAEGTDHQPLDADRCDCADNRDHSDHFDRFQYRTEPS